MDKFLNICFRLFVWLKTLDIRNLSLWCRDTFGSTTLTIWLLLHSKKLSDIFPIFPADFNIEEIINVGIFAKLLRWSATLAILGLIVNRALDKATWPQTPMVKPADPAPALPAATAPINPPPPSA